MSLVVLKPGLLTTLQDAGRYGHAALGIGAAGAADAVALRLANALVGNPADACALEFTLVGPRLRFEHAVVVALIGETAAKCDGLALDPWRPQRIDAGSELDCGALRHGARGYLAIAGGIEVTPVLGSRSTDVNAAIGPLHGRALQSGDVLPLRASTPPPKKIANWSLDPSPWFDRDGRAPIRLIAGSHFERLDAASHAALFDAEFRIAAASNRVGWRLDGPLLQLSAPLELISTGVVPGTLQLPPGGRPIVLGVEGPTSGGYPRIAHVIGVDLPRLAQRRPGDALRFELTDLGDAERRLREREHALRRLEAAIHARLTA